MACFKLDCQFEETGLVPIHLCGVSDLLYKEIFDQVERTIGSKIRTITKPMLCKMLEGTSVPIPSKRTIPITLMVVLVKTEAPNRAYGTCDVDVIFPFFGASVMECSNAVTTITKEWNILRGRVPDNHCSFRLTVTLQDDFAPVAWFDPHSQSCVRGRHYFITWREGRQMTTPLVPDLSVVEVS